MSHAITTKNYKKLVLQIGMHGASFCCIDTLGNSISHTYSMGFSKFQPLEEELWKLFTTHPELKMEYDEVLVLHDNCFNTFVPDALFDENFLGSYLQYNTKVFETDIFAFDALPNYELSNVYVPLMNINNYLLDRFGSFDYKNANSILVAKLLDASKNVDEKQVYVHVQDTHFEIVVARNQRLLLYNAFEYATPEDFLYYLLFTMEQLLLNPETVKVFLLGKTDEQHDCFALAYKYIRYVSIYEPAALQDKFGITQQDALQHFILYNA
jgi:hypothetical protein